MRILLVEDEPLIALAAKEALEDTGHQVFGPCASIDDALRLAKEHRPELAVVDIDLNGQNDGLEVVRRLKSELGIQAVYASGQADIARDHGDALGVLHKPYDDDELQSAIPVLQAVMAGRTPPPPPVSSALELF